MGGERAEGWLRLEISAHRPMLFLQLTAALSLLALDPFALGQREHLLVLDPELPSMQFEVIHGVYDRSSFFGRGEVGEGEAPENTIVEMVVEGIRQRQAQISHQLHQLFLLDSKRDVLDDDGRGDELLVHLVRKIVLSQRVLAETLAWMSRAQTREGEARETLGLLIQPSLNEGQTLVLQMTAV